MKQLELEPVKSEEKLKLFMPQVSIDKLKAEKIKLCNQWEAKFNRNPNVIETLSIEDL